MAPWYAAVGTPGHTPSCCLPPNKRLAADGRQLSLPCGVRGRGRPTVAARTRYAPGAMAVSGGEGSSLQSDNAPTEAGACRVAEPSVTPCAFSDHVAKAAPAGREPARSQGRSPA